MDSAKYQELAGRLRLNKDDSIVGGRNALYDKDWVAFIQEHFSELDKTSAVAICKLFFSSMEQVWGRVRLYRMATLFKILPKLWMIIRTDSPHRNYTITILAKSLELTDEIDEKGSSHQRYRPIVKQVFMEILDQLVASGDHRSLMAIEEMVLGGIQLLSESDDSSEEILKNSKKLIELHENFAVKYIEIDNQVFQQAANIREPVARKRRLTVFQEYLPYIQRAVTKLENL